MQPCVGKQIGKYLWLRTWIICKKLAFLLLMSVKLLSVSKRKTIFTNRHKTGRFNFAKEHEETHDEYWQRVLWLKDETKINLIGSDGMQHVYCGPGQDYCRDCIVRIVKLEGGSVMTRDCMSAQCVGEMRFMHCKYMFVNPNSEWTYKNISENNDMMVQHGVLCESGSAPYVRLLS